MSRHATVTEISKFGSLVKELKGKSWLHRLERSDAEKLQFHLDTAQCYEHSSGGTESLARRKV